MDGLLDSFFRAPPLARTAAAITLLLSLGIHLGSVPGGWFIYHESFMFKIPPQLWRLVTTFLITDKGLGLLFDTYFLYKYLSQLEVATPRFSRKEDLLWYLMFVGTTILGLNYLLGLHHVVFLKALILAMVYTVTQPQRGMKTNFYFITIPAQLTPYAMMAINLLYPEGLGILILQLLGLVAAHLYDFLTKIWPYYGPTGNSLLPTPAFMKRLVNIGADPRQRRAAGNASGSTAGKSSGPLPDSWGTRGPGHRLG